MSLNVDVDIEACKQGEREALGNLYKAYSGRLLKVCQHFLHLKVLGMEIENIINFLCLVSKKYPQTSMLDRAVQFSLLKIDCKSQHFSFCGREENKKGEHITLLF